MGSADMSRTYITLNLEEKINYSESMRFGIQSGYHYQYINQYIFQIYTKFKAVTNRTGLDIRHLSSISSVFT